MAAVCTVTPTATLSRAGCAWSSKKPDRASASESWTKDKLAARTSSTVPGRASLSDNWIRDKAARKETEHVERLPSRGIISQIGGNAEKEEISVERAGRSPSREIGARRALSRAPSVEVERSEKKVKPETDAEPVAVAVAVEYYAGPAFIKAPHPSELPLPTFPLFVKSPDPSELPIPKFLKARKPADDN
ncbi:uncharacterized protein C2845_PM01G18270 [Panicum miliaceum]|uniref:Uncharacterized protein n=1 Tax=Panicum miliaceum TaxID=4540 RepID=A0A3L6TIX8_PANMI|nr:uncharacterized protein C2845_PM01G18270 [Panicum miliaceum]